MKIHTVKQGEDIISIASQYKISDWQTLYDHEANSRLKSLRTDPNCLFPGDVVIIPDTEPTTISGATNQLHNMQISITTRKLLLNLLDIDKEPLKYCKYEIKLGSKIITGQTDGTGKIEENIVSTAKTGTIRIWQDPEDPTAFREIEFNLGHLDPIDEISGLQNRLMNLGYYNNTVDDEFGEKTREAVLNFQKDNNLQLTGLFNDETKAKLKEIYE